MKTENQKPKPDRSCATKTGHLDLLRTPANFSGWLCPPGCLCRPDGSGWVRRDPETNFCLTPRLDAPKIAGAGFWRDWERNLAETRRSPRVLTRIPILIAGEGPLYNAYTAVVNRQGALILSPADYPLESVVEIQNQNTGSCAKCQVVWRGGQDGPGLYKVGIELIDELPEFWAVDYQTAVPAAPQQL